MRRKGNARGEGEEGVVRGGGREVRLEEEVEGRWGRGGR